MDDLFHVVQERDQASQDTLIRERANAYAIQRKLEDIAIDRDRWMMRAIKAEEELTRMKEHGCPSMNSTA